MKKATHFSVRISSAQRFAIAATSCVAAVTSAALAGSITEISFLDAGRNLSFTQTGNGNSLSSNGAFYGADLTSTFGNAFSSVSMSYPGPGSPVDVPQISPTVFHYQTPSFATQADMDAAFPMGVYQFTGSLGATPIATASFQYTADDYPRTTPFLTGSDYTSLQGMNASQPFTFHFSPYVTGGTATSSFIFFTIFDNDQNALVFNDGFLAPGTTSVTVPANTLTPGDHFSYELDFSNRDNVPSPGAQFSAQLGFDSRTQGSFTAAVPEPATLAFLSIGLCGIATARRRR